jgi:tRNA modification GTPase
MNVEDTIVAVSSPPGSALRGIVRLSGCDSFRIAESVFKVDPDDGWQADRTNRCVRGAVRVAGADLPGMMLVFHAPKSYTRQDMVELHTLGAATILGMILEACLQAGARRANAGEFTARAFLAGAMGADQVQGVAAIISARTDSELEAAQRLLRGSLSTLAVSAREELAELLSLIEGAIDFADEPIDFITPRELSERLGRLLISLESTAEAGMRAERWSRPPNFVLVGPPNAGKSSLMNRLCGVGRAISSAQSGTTRDVLTAPITIDDISCLLVDVAGTSEARSEIDQKAQEASREAVSEAAVVLRVMDATLPINWQEAIPASSAELIVLNKCDLLSNNQRMSIIEQMPAGMEVCMTSALTGEGCETLMRLAGQMLTDRSDDRNEQAVALMSEHRLAMDNAVEALGRARKIAAAAPETLVDAEIVAAELRTAADSLGVLVGREDTEELLGRIFERFCVGK